MARQNKKQQKQRLRRGEARVEYLACVDNVRKLLADGHNLSSIHRTLLESGEITMGYKTFYDLVHPRTRNKTRCKE
jgi:hypothetical protein